jgi:hypothetical protein
MTILTVHVFVWLHHVRLFSFSPRSVLLHALLNGPAPLLSMLTRLFTCLAQVGNCDTVTLIADVERCGKHWAEPEEERAAANEHEQPVLPPVRGVRRVPLLALPVPRAAAGEVEAPVALRMRTGAGVPPPPGELGLERVGGVGGTAAQGVVGGADGLEAGVSLGGGDVSTGRGVGVMETDELIVCKLKCLVKSIQDHQGCDVHRDFMSFWLAPGARWNIWYGLGRGCVGYG